MADIKPRSAITEKSRYPFYAVGKGLFPDVYLTWAECFLNTHGVPGNKYKGFHSFGKAADFVRRHYKILRRRPRMSSRRSGSTSARSSSDLHPTHRSNAWILASNIVCLIIEAKFSTSAVYMAIKGSRLVTREQASRLLHTIGDGIQYGDWDVLKLVCDLFVPPVVESILRGLHSLSKTTDPTFRLNSYSESTRQDVDPVLHANIDEETFVCGGAGLPSGNECSGVGQG